MSKVYLYITGASITNERTEIKIDKIHNKSGAKFTKDNLGENQTHRNRFSGNCTTGHADGDFIAYRNTKLKRTRMMIA